jgi:hypothetical protein
MSFNYGNAPLGALGWEEGMQDLPGVTENLSFEIDTWMNFDAEQGVNISGIAGGQNLGDLAFTNGPILDDGTTVTGQVTISWDPVNGASFTTTGLNTNADFSNVATGAFAGDDGFTFNISSRVGGANATVLIDNLVIDTDPQEEPEARLVNVFFDEFGQGNAVLEGLTPDATYHVAGTFGDLDGDGNLIFQALPGSEFVAPVADLTVGPLALPFTVEEQPLLLIKVIEGAIPAP